MKAYRYFVDWDAALAVAKQRSGRLFRSTKINGWVFTPSSGHIFDTLSDEEQKIVRICGPTFKGKHCTFEEIRTTTWTYYEEHVRRIVSSGFTTTTVEDDDDSSRNVVARDYVPDAPSPLPGQERFIDDNDYVARDYKDWPY